jgi:hypothetical protein
MPGHAVRRIDVYPLCRDVQRRLQKPSPRVGIRWKRREVIVMVAAQTSGTLIKTGFFSQVTDNAAFLSIDAFAES